MTNFVCPGCDYEYNESRKCPECKQHFTVPTEVYNLADIEAERTSLIVGYEKLKDERDSLASKLDAVREVLYERFAKGKCSELVAVGLIEKIVQERPK